jgi:hypothetical protein
VNAELSIPSKKEYLSPNERGRLRVQLTNKGVDDIQGVVASVRPDQSVRGISYNESINVGDILRGSTRLAIFYFTATEKVPSQTAAFWIDVRDGKGRPVSDPCRVTVVTRSRGSN